MKGLSYAWKTVLPFLVLFLLAIIISNNLVARSVNQSNFNNWEQNLTQQARLYAELASPMIQNGSPYTGVDKLAKSPREQVDVRITIILANGQVIGDSIADPSSIENQIFFPEVKSALAGIEYTNTRETIYRQGDILYVAVPVYANDLVIGVARTSISMSVMNTVASKIRNLNLLVLLFTSVAAAILAILLTSRGINPLRRLTAQVDTLAGNDEIKPLRTTHGRDEIGALTASLNHLMSKLDQKINGLKAEQATLNAVLSNMSDGAIVVTSDGNVQMMNEAAIRLFNVDGEITGERSLIEVTRLYQLVDLWKKCLSTESTQTTLLELLPGKDSLQVIASSMGSSYPGSILLLAQDLTELRKLQNIRRDFVNNVSYQLNTPLASMKSLAVKLQSAGWEDRAASGKLLDQMNGQIDEMTQMVQELIQLARIESGREPFEFKPLLPKEIILPAVERMQPQAERSGLVLKTEIAADLPEILADGPRLQEVLVNLIHNAVKFTQPSGIITVKAEKRESEILFSVADTGMGIKPAELDRIFERFYRSESTRGAAGTGLGLSIARHTVEAHKGRIWAESEPGQGTVFFFTIPIA